MENVKRKAISWTELKEFKDVYQEVFRKDGTAKDVREELAIDTEDYNRLRNRLGREFKKMNMELPALRKEGRGNSLTEEQVEELIAGF